MTTIFFCQSKSHVYKLYFFVGFKINPNFKMLFFDIRPDLIFKPWYDKKRRINLDSSLGGLCMIPKVHTVKFYTFIPNEYLKTLNWLKLQWRDQAWLLQQLCRLLRQIFLFGETREGVRQRNRSRQVTRWAI